MARDLLIRGGTVVDGTGAPGFRADVRVRSGHIVEVAPALRPDGERVLDAAGAYVTPGFIDTHTHFDPTLFWDPFCDPMPLHGVTTVLVGNCSLSLAPVRPDQRAEITRVFCYVEDLPVATFDEAIPWSWEGYADYLRALGGDGLGVDVATLVGHTALRLYVMGDDAWERSSTGDERAAIAGALDECLRAGAFGMSTSLGFDELPGRGPVPSRLADDEELALLADQLAVHGAILEFLPASGGKALRRDVQRMADITGPRGVTSTWIGVFHDVANPDLAQGLLDFAGELQQRGVPTYPQVSPRTLDMRVNWDGGMSFARLREGWQRFVQADRAGKGRLVLDPAWRAMAREEWDRVDWTILPHRSPERVRLLDARSPEDQRFVGGSLADLVAARGGHPSDVLADWVAENGCDPGILGVGVANSDPDGVASTLTHPAAIVSNSDAGAHLQMMCAAGDSTLLLSRHVRDRGDMTLEHGVHALTGRQADLLGLTDRGVVTPGRRADLTVFDLAELRWEADHFVRDLPAGGSRLRRPAGGYRATIVAGELTLDDGTDTGARPGTVVRRGTAT
jgi:N-acyl-D-amino-acid deacylase